MRTIFNSIGTLLISAAILLAGGGLLSTLIAVRAGLEGFPFMAIGIMASAYYIGFTAGCFGTPYLVKRAGHIRVFAALSALVAAIVLSHAIFVNIPLWIVLRCATGFSFAGLYILIESWINERSSNKNRGKVLSIYRVVDLGAVTAGQFMLTIADPKEFILFSLVAILICLSIFPISLTKAEAPLPISDTKLNLKKLIKVSPLAVAGVVCVGLANGAFWGIAPVFVQQLGHPMIIVSTFMSVAIFGGALLQWPVGVLSDKFGRRSILLLVTLGSMGSGIFLWQYSAQSLHALVFGGFLYGVFGMQIFGLSAAHANDYAKPDEFVAISGGLLMLYGLGSIIGPFLAPIIMTLSTPQSLFVFTACVHASLVVYGLYRRTRRDEIDDTDDYVAIPNRTTPAIFRLDPRYILRMKK